MGLIKTGYTEKTAENFIIDSATVFTDFRYDTETKEFTGTPMGATSGGVEFNSELSYRKVEVDGTYVMDVVGLNVLESATASIKANLIELTAENLRRSINGTLASTTEEEAPEGYMIIKPKRYLSEGDYISSLAIAGIHNGTKQPVIVVIDQGLVKSGLALKTEDNKEAVIEQEITANATYEQLAKDEFPWRIYYPSTTTA
ncbi:MULTISPECIES: hypothetical protein [unclassified Enterococcus]|uniref:hypothetical protein n=1 Tax=unclassified Enterococcus TaxID=2608891 RepID=UPI0013ED7E38|nr:MULTISPECIES: hypothetical protein [unclassified Enterococcus]